MYGSPAIDKDGTIYFATSRLRGLDSLFYALNRDGTLKWRYNILRMKHWSSPAIADDGTVYYVTIVGTYAFFPNGDLKWNIPQDGLESSPVIGPHGTIYWCDWKYLYAVDPAGSVKWQMSGGDEFHHPIVGLDGTIYFNNRDRGTLVAVNPDGSIKWEFADSVRFDFDSAVLDADGTLYFFGGWGLYAVTKDGQLKWKNARLDRTNGISCPAIASDHTLIFADATYLYAISPEGEIKWKVKDEEITSPPVADAQGNIYLAHADFFDAPVITCYGIDGVLKWKYSKSPRGTITGGTLLGANGILYLGFESGEDYHFYAIY